MGDGGWDWRDTGSTGLSWLKRSRACAITHVRGPLRQNQGGQLEEVLATSNCYQSYIFSSGDYSVLSQVLCSIHYVLVDYLFCLWKGLFRYLTPRHFSRIGVIYNSAGFVNCSAPEHQFSTCCLRTSQREGPSRWQRSKTWRSPSSPQIHQKYIYIWSNFYRTPTVRWQKTSTSQKMTSGNLHAEAGPNAKLNPRSSANKEEKRKFPPAASGAVD